VHLRRPQLLVDERITLVLDAGASDGAWAQALRKSGYAGRIVSFEPLASAHEKLARLAAADDAWTAHRVALGDRDGRTTLHVAANAQSSSVLWMASRHVAAEPSSHIVRSEEVGCARVDELVQVGADDRAYLKLDVQGSELALLRGAERVLQQTRVVEAELSLAELYEGQPLLHDVAAFLHEHGFALVGLETTFRDRATDDTLQVNGLFRRGG
jgi:FkbM family methyltransferase